MYLFHSKKSNMAVTKSDPDHKVRKMSITFNAFELSMRACSRNAIDSLTRLFERKSYLCPFEEMPHAFVRGQSVVETCFSDQS